MYELLNTINSPDDLKAVPPDSLDRLSAEIREFLIEKILANGGHLASNLGVVELTIALHRSFNVPTDKLVWDVGHQSYVHKLICGRRDRFDTIRKLDGISGFPKTAESIYDAFDAGHSGTAISAALGLAAARDLKGDAGEVVAVVGDASLTNGLSMEALNHMAHCHNKVIVVLNDNQMSIGQAIGGFAQYLNKIRTNASYYTIKRETNEFLTKIPLIGRPLIALIKRIKRFFKYFITPGVVFERLGYKYLGPIDGHNIKSLCDVFEEAKKIDEPVLVHVFTKKGKGFAPAEELPSKYHAVSPLKKKTSTFSEQFGIKLQELAAKNEKIVAVCPSMTTACGLRQFMQTFPKRFFDTGIAEGHAVTFAAGLARGGYTPVVAVYSSFLQRAYDSIVHDVALTGLHVVLAVDRAGLVGDDGETHQGILDLSFLSTIPHLTILAPADFHSLQDMLAYAVEVHTGPIAIRYPRGGLPLLPPIPFALSKAALLRDGTDITIAAVGRMVHTALSVATLLEKKFSVQVLDVRTVKPIDADGILTYAAKTGRLITIEDNTAPGGVGEALAAEAELRGINLQILSKAFPDTFVRQGSVPQLMELYGLDAQSIINDIEGMLGK